VCGGDHGCILLSHPSQALDQGLQDAADDHANIPSHFCIEISIAEVIELTRKEQVLYRILFFLAHYKL
jgi:hypothetical protein